MDVTGTIEVTVVKSGIHRLLIDPEELVDDIDEAKIWEFRVEHGHGSFAHYGVVLFTEDHDKNFGMGQ
jgi:isopentenyl phosphate kinase